MKAQKLGLVLGINIAAACLVLQGCKAKQGGKAVQPSPTDNRVTVISRPSAPVQRPAPVVVAPVAEPQALPAQPIPPEPVVTVTPAPVPAPIMQEPPPPPPAPSAVRTVKKLPAAPAKGPKAKPAAATVKAAATPADAATSEYIVKPGDTLFLISKRTNYRQAAIVAANPGLNPNRLRVGQKLNLPGAVAKAPVLAAKDAPKDDAAKDKVKPAAAPAAANTVAPVKTKGGFVPYEGPTKDYVVKSGDSVGQIAVTHGISIRALKALNGLKGDALRAGQKLKVPAEKQIAAKPAAAAKDAPAKDVPAKPAVVAKADDAKAAPVPEVKEAAAPTPAADVAKPAEPVKAVEPVKSEEAAKVEEPAPAQPAEAPAPAQLTHTVKEGEDLVSIAIAYGISPSALMDINDLKPTDEVKPGQVLKLPANAKRTDI